MSKASSDLEGWVGLISVVGLFGAISCSSVPNQAGDMMAPDMQSPAPDMQWPQPPVAIHHDGTLGPVGGTLANGPPLPASQSQYVHACGKIPYATLGRILKSRGITTTAGAQCPNALGNYDCTAGSLYTNGSQVLGIANYPARVPDDPWNSTVGMYRLQDILIAAAEALVTTGNASGTFAAGTDCSGTQLFNGTTCDARGFACFVGMPLTAAQLSLCNQMLSDPSCPTDPLVAKRLTLATVAASIYLCN